ncbi:transposable element Tcb2 transposase [Trichonephila clavipes]|nr:transposable element Tcb2 transposase [Trichonephila clavipes]
MATPGSSFAPTPLGHEDNLERCVRRGRPCTSRISDSRRRKPKAPSLGAPVSSRTIRSRLAEGHFGIAVPITCVALDAHHRRLCLEWCHTRGNWTAAEWNSVVFSDESRFNFSSDDNHVRVWRPRGERLNLAFSLQRHHSHSWCDGLRCHCLQYNNIRSPLVMIRSTMTA